METLDDVLRIREVDRHRMLDGLLRFPDLCEDALRVAREVRVPRAYRRATGVVVAGLGASAIGGDMARDLLAPACRVPITVCRDYGLPAFVGGDTLVFAVSYSGDTEEALCSFVDALRRGAMVVGITSDGELERFCVRLGVPLVRVPPGLPPRGGLPYLLIPILVVLGRLGFAAPGDEEIREAVEVLREVRDAVSPELPADRNPAKGLASSVYGTVPIIYGTPSYRAVATRMKTQFNENAKVLAKSESFPELNHNEIMGWEGIGRLAKSFSVIMIRDHDEDERTRVMVETVKELILRRGGVRVLEIWARGRSRIAKLLSAVYMGDFTSFYLAVLSGVDPLPVGSITLLKRRLEELGGKEKARAEVERMAARRPSRPS